jgi:hypothetical protein
MQLRCTSTSSLPRTGVLFKVRCGVTSELESPQLAVPWCWGETPSPRIWNALTTVRYCLSKTNVCVTGLPSAQEPVSGVVAYRCEMIAFPLFPTHSEMAGSSRL